MNAAPVAAANSRLRKMPRSSMGAGVRCSIATKAGRSTAAAASPAITTGSSSRQAALGHRQHEPGEADDIGGRAREVEPRRVSGVASSRRITAPHAAAASASGTLNQNTHSHRMETSTPPSTGPSTRPTAATMVLVPSARPSSWRGKASVTSAAAFANRNAAPTSRPTTKNST